MAGLLVIAALVLAGCGREAPARLVVADAWVREVLPGQGMSAAYLRLENRAGEADTLLGAQSPAARAVEIHQMSSDNGTMKMQKLERLEVPAGGAVSLQPGGTHLMLIGLTRDLREGDQVELSLRFAKAGTTEVMAPVRRVR